MQPQNITRNTRSQCTKSQCIAIVDPAFDISAYGFAAQSIIAPCAGMVVVWTVMLAPWTLGEQLTRLPFAALIAAVFFVAQPQAFWLPSLGGFLLASFLRPRVSSLRANGLRPWFLAA